MMLLRDFYREVKKAFSASNNGAALDARILITHVLKLSHEQFILAQERQLSSDEMDKINTLVEQRLTHKPVAKIIGHKEFYGRAFVTNEHTLDPRPDSEVLLEHVLKHVPIDGDAKILDLGTGTGCLILTLLAERSFATGLAVDRSEQALNVAQANAENLQLDHRVAFMRSDWFGKVTGTFDIIVSNPPYIPSGDIATLAHDVKHHDPIGALDGGADGLDPYRVIADRAADFLNPGGLIAFEVGIGQAQDVADILENKGFQPLQIVNDLAGIARVVLAKRL